MPELERFTEHLINELKTKGISPEVVKNASSGLREEIEQLQEALLALYDEQSGPPLLRRAEQWNVAMDLARRALRRCHENSSSEAQ